MVNLTYDPLTRVLKGTWKHKYHKISELMYIVEYSIMHMHLNIYLIIQKCSYWINANEWELLYMYNQYLLAL